MTIQTRPRAAHKLNLRDGDVVELIKWQDDCVDWVGHKYKVVGIRLVNITDAKDVWKQLITNTGLPKGDLPLFTVVSRAADAKQDEVIVLSGREYEDSWDLGPPAYYDTHRFTLTFPHGSDTGTVVREAL